MVYILTVLIMNLIYSSFTFTVYMCFLFISFQREMSLYDGLDIDNEDGGSTKPVVGNTYKAKISKMNSFAIKINSLNFPFWGTYPNFC